MTIIQLAVIVGSIVIGLCSCTLMNREPPKREFRCEMIAPTMYGTKPGKWQDKCQKEGYGYY